MRNDGQAIPLLHRFLAFIMKLVHAPAIAQRIARRICSVVDVSGQLKLHHTVQLCLLLSVGRDRHMGWIQLQARVLLFIQQITRRHVSQCVFF